jgi:DNA-binding NarL/FixJ family response regulator
VTTRLLLVDDQALVRAGFRKLLEAEEGLEVVGEAADGAQAIDLCRRHRPHVVLMDIRMPVLDGISATKQIVTEGNARVLVLTTYDLDEYVFTALTAGASGFLLKDAPPDDLVAAIHVVASGDALLAPRVTRRLVDQFVQLRAQHRDATGVLARLTEREREVLLLLGRGSSNREIATVLHLGETTVKSHVASILQKLQVRDRVHAVVFAYEAGVVRPGEA